MPTTDQARIEAKMADELRTLVRKTKGEMPYPLPEGVLHAIEDWRFTDVVTRLQEHCDQLTLEHIEDREQLGATKPATVLSHFMEYLWLHGLLLEWRQLKEKFRAYNMRFTISR